jgi:hypothetical protein
MASTLAPTARQLKEKFGQVQRAGKGFIPGNAVFVLRPGKQAERHGKAAWLLFQDSRNLQLLQGPSVPMVRRWTRRDAYKALDEILRAYRN